MHARDHDPLRVGRPPTLARALRSTNAIDSIDLDSREHGKQGKRWHDGQIVLRSWAACMVEVSKQFRRDGDIHLRALRSSLTRHIAAESVEDGCNPQNVSVA